MTEFTRLSIVGAKRRADVVVPSAEPVGTLLPRLLELLEETGGTIARPLSLVTADGEQLDIARSAQQLALLDGTALRLVRLDAAPPPPVVIDVTDAAADAHGARDDRWDDGTRLAAGLTGIGGAAALLGMLAPLDPSSGIGLLLATVAVLLVPAVGLGLGGLVRVAACFTAAAAGMVLPIGWTATLAVSGPSGAAAGLAAAITSASVVVALGVGVALRRRGALAGGALGAVLGGLLLILLLAGVGVVAASGVTGVVAAFATGLLPWFALSASGVTALDHSVSDGARVERVGALRTIDEAYAALTWSVGVTAAVIATTGVALVLAGELWAGLLALALALTAALRTRSFPLRAQGWLLWLAVGAIAVAGALSLARVGAWWAVAACAAAVLVIAVAALVRPRPHVRARLRGIGNALETLAVVALLPLLLGAMGVYAELLRVFGAGS